MLPALAIRNALDISGMVEYIFGIQILYSITILPIHKRYLLISNLFVHLFVLLEEVISNL